MTGYDRVAERHNTLLADSKPFALTDSGAIVGPIKVTGVGVTAIAQRLYERIKPILDAAIPAVDAEEIASAARERRPAGLVRPAVSPYWWGEPPPWEGSKALWLHCLSQIRECIAADNAERMAAYERYREACMAGVATA